MIHDWCNGYCEGCPEDSSLLAGAPIGMYHCPYCGMMLLAGSTVKHPTCEDMDRAMVGAPTEDDDV